MEQQQEFDRLRELHPSARLIRDAGNIVVFLPKFGFRSDGRKFNMDLLLCPHAHSGYETRLFFEQRVDGKGKNWTQHHVIGRNWWACSWQGVAPSASWTTMLCAHLRAVA